MAEPAGNGPPAAVPADAAAAEVEAMTFDLQALMLKEE